MLQVINKLKTTFFAFQGTNIIFNNKAFLKMDDFRQITVKQEKQIKKIKKSEIQNYCQNNNKNCLPKNKDHIITNRIVKK